MCELLIVDWGEGGAHHHENQGRREREAIYVNPFVGSRRCRKMWNAECVVDVLLECLR